MMELLVFPFFLIVVLLSLALTGVWIWALIDCLTRPDDTLEPTFGTLSPKLVWALIIFFTHIIGVIVYVIVAGTRKTPKRGAPPPRPTDADEVRRILEMIASGKITAAEGQRLLVVLGTAGTQAVPAQPSTPAPVGRALLIGCLLLILIPLLLLVAFFLLRVHGVARIRQEMSTRNMQLMEDQVRQQQRGQLESNPPLLEQTAVLPPPAPHASSPDPQHP